MKLHELLALKHGEGGISITVDGMVVCHMSSFNSYTPLVLQRFMNYEVDKISVYYMYDPCDKLLPYLNIDLKEEN